MITQKIDNRLQTIFAALGVSASSLRNDSHFSRDLSLDSLEIANLKHQVEMRFCIQIHYEQWWQLETVGQLKDYLSHELTFERDPVQATNRAVPGDMNGPSL